ncbi:putative lipoate-protein ligase [Rhodococcus opacus B4]|uniref:Putative lipoate-protein ligase n=1 Tax=Rhodococcus opacus (strain B4) TaxID=632772 RepID=C1B655_RHOOB|nr:putative lipoate-protein ligase [Rhodococcus opacus B4]
MATAPCCPTSGVRRGPPHRTGGPTIRRSSRSTGADRLPWRRPGQLIVDVVRYVRGFDEALVSVCTDLGLECDRVEGRSGVQLPPALESGQWLPERKSAAIGVRVPARRGVALVRTQLPFGAHRI